MSDEKVEVRCGGGIIHLEGGVFTYFIELHILNDSFTFESLEEFEDEKEAETKAFNCMESLPLVLMQCLKNKSLDLFDMFCEEWQLVKIIYDEDAPVGDDVSSAEDLLH